MSLLLSRVSDTSFWRVSVSKIFTFSGWEWWQIWFTKLAVITSPIPYVRSSATFSPVEKRDCCDRERSGPCPRGQQITRLRASAPAFWKPTGIQKCDYTRKTASYEEPKPRGKALRSSPHEEGARDPGAVINQAREQRKQQSRN